MIADVFGVQASDLNLDLGDLIKFSLPFTSQSNLGVIPPKFLNLTFITLFLLRFIVNIY